MNNLRRIRNGKGRRTAFLGVMGSFFIETLDQDRLIRELAPEYFNYWHENQKRLFGQDARLILKNFHNSFLVVIRTKNESSAEIVAFVGAKSWLTPDIIEDIKRLASHRWPKLILSINKSLINNIQPSLTEILKQLGWTESPKNNQWQTQLYDH